MRLWLLLLNIIGGEFTLTPFISEGVILMSKVFFIRENPEDLLKEQNRLLNLLIAKQSEAPQVVVVEKQTAAQNVVETLVEDQFDFEVDDIPFIPKAVVGTSNIQTMEVSKSKFNKDEVEKLREAKQAKAKK